jgi:hypothetical protein
MLQVQTGRAPVTEILVTLTTSGGSPESIRGVARRFVDLVAERLTADVAHL